MKMVTRVAEILIPIQEERDCRTGPNFDGRIFDEMASATVANLNAHEPYWFIPADSRVKVRTGIPDVAWNVREDTHNSRQRRQDRRIPVCLFPLTSSPLYDIPLQHPDSTHVSSSLAITENLL
ncbi:hypothetical protein WG66_000740 [Moniliophthora roreri]|nr:hypothetical protein WG66_000740 [Moniliophthora roreri]